MLFQFNCLHCDTKLETEIILYQPSEESNWDYPGSANIYECVEIECSCGRIYDHASIEDLHDATIQRLLNLL